MDTKHLTFTLCAMHLHVVCYLQTLPRCDVSMWYCKSDLHEGLHAACSSPAILAALHSAQLMQVLQQHPALLYGSPQLPFAHMHLHTQRRSAFKSGNFWLSGHTFGGGREGGGVGGGEVE